MKIVVTGGRDFKDKNFVDEVLYALNPKEIFVGDAQGVDAFTVEWAELNGITGDLFYADWENLGKKAGPIRNRTMLKAASRDAIVIAFPGGKGTENCIKQAKELGMIVLRAEK